jgi:hypothetical protein
MKCFLICLFSLIHLQTDAQDLKKQSVKFTFKNEKSTDFSIETFKFYVSQLVFLKNGEIVFEERNSFHLIDIINTKNQFSFDVNESVEYDQIQFLLGIDSLTNVSGALDGDLDPTKGMYWAWQSGYINFKLEGIHLDCPARDNKFEFHLGGYLPPFLAAKKVLLNCTNQELLQVEFNLEAFFNQINFETTQRIMSPGQNAVDLSVICAKQFRIIE